MCRERVVIAAPFAFAVDLAICMNGVPVQVRMLQHRGDYFVRSVSTSWLPEPLLGSA